MVTVCVVTRVCVFDGIVSAHEALVELYTVKNDRDLTVKN